MDMNVITHTKQKNCWRENEWVDNQEMERRNQELADKPDPKSMLEMLIKNSLYQFCQWIEASIWILLHGDYNLYFINVQATCYEG